MLNLAGQLPGYDVALERLLEIFTTTSMDFDHQTQAVLESCAEFLDMPAGKVGEIQGDNYLLIATIGPAPVQKTGTIVPLKDVMGLPAGPQQKPVAYSSLADSPYASHRQHRVDGLQCYLGAPLCVDGEILGAISFAGFEPRVPPIGRSEMTLIRLAAEWIGTQVNLRRKLAKRLEREAQIKTLYRTAPCMTATLNRQGIITDVSDKWLETIGYERGEVVGRPGVNFLAPEHRIDSIENVQPEIWKKGLVLQTPRRYVSRNGDLVECENSSIAIKNEDGEYDSFLTIVTDVTARNRAQAELAEKNAELEQVNEQLRRYACVASHDLQEPLRKIRMFGDQLADDLGEKLQGESKFALNSMVSAAARLSSLVSDVLSLSQVAYAELSMKEVDLEQTIHQALADLDATIRENSGRVHVGMFPSVLGDADQLLRVFRNMIGNALKYHKDGDPPVVEIDCTDDDAQSGIVVTIKDSGIGFDGMHAERIFDAFYRLNTQREYCGSGIGLAIVRTIVENHGWRVVAESRAKGGASFNIFIPASHICGTSV